METGKGGPLPHTLTLHNRLDRDLLLSSFFFFFCVDIFFMMVVLPHIKH